MNNYIIIEQQNFEQKLNAYNVLFNYRICNLCVKADPTALVSVTVVASNIEFNIEEVADTYKKDDFTFDVYPKNPNNFQDIIGGILDMHPEFKMEIITDKNEDGKEISHATFTMPYVDKDRRNLLNDTAKAFHKECQVNLDACYAKLQTTLVEPYTMMSPEEIDEANDAFKQLYDTYKQESDKLLEAKLAEIEEGYQRYLTADNEHYTQPNSADNVIEEAQDPEIEALFRNS